MPGTLLDNEVREISKKSVRVVLEPTILKHRERARIAGKITFNSIS